VVNPFESGGDWLRCALHAHTTNSDGELAPELLARHYARAGFDVLAITDHHVRTVVDSTDAILVVPSTELDADVAEDRDAHVLGLGVEADPEPRGQVHRDLPGTVAWIREGGGLPFLAHTHWSGLRTTDFAACDGLAGLEVYNGGCALEVGQGLATLHWDEALAGGRGLLAIASDDCHHPGFDSAVGWVWARCAERTREAVLAALAGGAFYSSAGPRILALRLADGAVEVETTPARRITLVAGPRLGSSVSAGRLGYAARGEVLAQTAEGEIEAARLVRPLAAPFGRIEVEDAAGRLAWTNPLWN
jgi:hypothetical protein